MIEDDEILHDPDDTWIQYFYVWDERISDYLVYVPDQGNFKTLAGELKKLLKKY